MSSSYSTRLGYELINPGEQSNAWGTSTNNTLSNSVEESIAGVYTLNLASAGATYTLTSTDGGGAASTNEQRQFAMLMCGLISIRLKAFGVKLLQQRLLLMLGIRLWLILLCKHVL